MPPIDITALTPAMTKAKIGSPGLRKMLAAERSDLTTIPSVVADYATATTYDEPFIITADFVFASGKQWHPVYITQEKNKLEWKAEEVNHDQTGAEEAMLEVWIPSNSPELRGFIEFLKREDIILLVETGCGTGEYHALGLKKCSPVRLVSYKGATGATSNDEKGFTLTFKQLGGVVPLYTGAIQDTPAA